MWIFNLIIITTTILLLLLLLLLLLYFLLITFKLVFKKCIRIFYFDSYSTDLFILFICALIGAKYSMCCSI